MVGMAVKTPTTTVFVGRSTGRFELEPFDDDRDDDAGEQSQSGRKGGAAVKVARAKPKRDTKKGRGRAGMPAVGAPRPGSGSAAPGSGTSGSGTGAGASAPQPPMVPQLPSLPPSAPLADGAADQALAAAAGAPYASAMLAALSEISAQFGQGTANPADTSALAADGPSGAVTYGGDSGDGYVTVQQGAAEKAAALRNMDDDLRRVMEHSAGNANLGRERIDDIIDQVNAATAALGPVADTPAGKQMVLAAVAQGLESAGILLGQEHSDSSDAASQVSDLVDRYLAETAPIRVRVHRGSGGGGYHGGYHGFVPLTRPSGNVASWIDHALRTMAASGMDVSHMDESAIATIIAHESGGNPNSINLWDSNAAAGHPSKGLMQCIDSTFNAHCLPGHHDIWNPVDNIIAGVRYAEARYGSLDNVPGIRAMHHGGHYVGY